MIEAHDYTVSREPVTMKLYGVHNAWYFTSDPRSS